MGVASGAGTGSVVVDGETESSGNGSSGNGSSGNGSSERHHPQSRPLSSVSVVTGNREHKGPACALLAVLLVFSVVALVLMARPSN